MAEENRAAQAASFGRELSTAVVMFHEAVGAHLGVSAGDQRALALIGSHGPMPAGELAERTGLTPGAVTGMIDRLERAGLARREADPADRRRVLVQATGAPWQVFDELASAMSALSDRYDETEQRVIADWVTRTIGILNDQTKRLTRRTAGR